MKVFFAIVIWAIIAYFLAPGLVNIRTNGRETNNTFAKWLILFLLPIIIISVLALMGVVVVAGLSIVGLILVLLPIILIAAYFAGKINFNGNKYKF